jgi:hypothetical protein
MKKGMNEWKHLKIFFPFHLGTPSLLLYGFW